MSSYATTPQATVAYGLLELNSAGTVIRYCPEGCDSVAPNRDAVVGRNFFTDIAPGEPTAILKAQFDSFVDPGVESSQNLDQRYEVAGQMIHIQLLLARKKGTTNGNLLALVRVTPDDTGKKR